MGVTRPRRRHGRHMHATIRHYAPGAGSGEEGVRAWRALAAALSGEAGFISCAVLATGDGGLAAISFFDDAASLAAADRKIEGWLAERAADLARLLVQVASGEVVAQRGL
jgi:heme-degrading monooxygenase HmoA